MLGSRHRTSRIAVLSTFAVATDLLTLLVPPTPMGQLSAPMSMPSRREYGLILGTRVFGTEQRQHGSPVIDEDFPYLAPIS